MATLAYPSNKPFPFVNWFLGGVLLAIVALLARPVIMAVVPQTKTTTVVRDNPVQTMGKSRERMRFIASSLPNICKMSGDFSVSQFFDGKEKWAAPGLNHEEEHTGVPCTPELKKAFLEAWQKKLQQAFGDRYDWWFEQMFAKAGLK